jgi:hypothetical protein
MTDTRSLHPDSHEPLDSALALLRAEAWAGAHTHPVLERMFMQPQTRSSSLPRWAIFAGMGLFLAGSALGAAAHRYFGTIHFATASGEHLSFDMAEMNEQPDGSFTGTTVDGQSLVFIAEGSAAAAPPKEGAPTMVFQTEDGKTIEVDPTKLGLKPGDAPTLEAKQDAKPEAKPESKPR